MILARGYSVTFKYKGCCIGGITAIKGDVTIEYEEVADTLFIQCDLGNGFIQFIAHDYSIRKLGE